MNEPSENISTRINPIHLFPGVGLEHPLPENNPGVFLELFDLSQPYGDGRDGMIYTAHYNTAREAAASAGWVFRSYSVLAKPGTNPDFVARQIRHFPSLILFRDGVELGRHIAFYFNTVPRILCWANKLLGIECDNPIPQPGTPGFTPSTTTTTMNDDSDPDLMALREELERHFASGSPLEIIYFGGGLPGMSRVITPLRYCEKRGRSHIIGLCHRSGIEKTFRLDRMHLPGPPLADGINDFRILAKCLGNAHWIDGMLSQIARLGNLPIEEALAAHLEKRGEFESFFDEYSYGGYTLELKITSTVIYLSLGYEANTFETMHYKFTPESEPRLTPEIATHYSLCLGRPATLSPSRRDISP